MGSLSSHKEQKIQKIDSSAHFPERRPRTELPGTLVLKYDAEKRVGGCLLAKMAGSPPGLPLAGLPPFTISIAHANLL
jgi:hypothetical protein